MIALRAGRTALDTDMHTSSHDNWNLWTESKVSNETAFVNATKSRINNIKAIILGRCSSFTKMVLALILKAFGETQQTLCIDFPISITLINLVIRLRAVFYQ